MGRLEQNLTWTASQRTVIAGLLVVLMMLIAWRAWRHGQHITNPPPDRPPRETRLADRLDPNTADLMALATLPGIGESRAQAIITYRTSHAARGSIAPAFAQIDDLLKVPGIGIAIIEQLRDHLTFPGTDATPEPTEVRGD